jgi:hypothetical protein
MKVIRFVPVLFVIATATFFTSCVPSVESNETPNALIANIQNVQLTPTDTVTDKLSLVCGCTFRLTVDAFTGDTASIHWQAGKFQDTLNVWHSFPLDSLGTPHPVWIYATPNARKGLDTAYIAFGVHDYYTFFDTVRVILNVP